MEAPFAIDYEAWPQPSTNNSLIRLPEFLIGDILGLNLSES
jgi:hypothetical protein